MTYGKGYGEETDFCLRARKKGLTHYICDTTYIYHKGMASYGRGGKKKLYNALAKLDAQYPDYNEEISSFINKNPLEKIQKNIAVRTATWDFSGCKSRILYIPSTENNASCQYNDEISRDGCMVYVIRQSGVGLSVSEYNNESWVEYFFDIESTSSNTLLDLFEKIFCTFRISRICMCSPQKEVISIAEKFGIPYIPYSAGRNSKIIFFIRRPQQTKYFHQISR